MALSTPGTTPKPAAAAPAPKPVRSPVVRLGPPANDNKQSSWLIRVLAFLLGGAVVVLAMRWFGVV